MLCVEEPAAQLERLDGGWLMVHKISSRQPQISRGGHVRRECYLVSGTFLAEILQLNSFEKLQVLLQTGPEISDSL